MSIPIRWRFATAAACLAVGFSLASGCRKWPEKAKGGNDTFDVFFANVVGMSGGEKVYVGGALVGVASKPAIASDGRFKGYPFIRVRLNSAASSASLLPCTIFALELDTSVTQQRLQKRIRQISGQVPPIGSTCNQSGPFVGVRGDEDLQTLEKISAIVNIGVEELGAVVRKGRSELR